MKPDEELEPDEHLASALGVPLFTTGLFIPRYSEGEFGRWRISRVPFGLDRGYHTGLWAVRDMPVLLRRAGDPPSWETWMSISPREVESQELGIRDAFGETVVMGLGMGWSAVNVALNPAVGRVTVIERDPDVIDLFEHSAGLDGVPDAAVRKLKVIEADALEWRPGQAVDYLYADIWRSLAEPQALDDVRRMQSNVGARRICFWGQEVIIYALAKQLPGAAGRLSNPMVRRIIEDLIGLPLLIPPGEDYAGTIERVVKNRRAMGLSGMESPPVEGDVRRHEERIDTHSDGPRPRVAE